MMNHNCRATEDEALNLKFIISWRTELSCKTKLERREINFLNLMSLCRNGWKSFPNMSAGPVYVGLAVSNYVA